MNGFSDPNIEKMSLDVTSDDDVQRVVRDILEIEGRIDVVVNNAGILAIGVYIIQIPDDAMVQYSIIRRSSH
jgi:1-acylglycerone phosphate reductase